MEIVGESIFDEKWREVWEKVYWKSHKRKTSVGIVSQGCDIDLSVGSRGLFDTRLSGIDVGYPVVFSTPPSIRSQHLVGSLNLRSGQQRSDTDTGLTGSIPTRRHH